ncbi:tryptophan synthase beta subunit-like PLP-dependent enzyme [Mycena amicta]|nr:tryptophan synthase beta subunit-like PLP-dependent enzyme [Mycena amicta]
MSFKSRGMSFFVKRAKEVHGPALHAVVASGGNAALAAACAARSLDVRCTVFIPAGAAQSTLDLLANENAQVIVGGKHYAEALRAAKQFADAEEHGVVVPAYEDPIVWEGHSTIVTELVQQMPDKPRAIFCSVGGGGLLGGIILGCARVGWDSVPLVAVETVGTNCFYFSMALNRHWDVALPEGVTAVHDEAHNVQLAHFDSFSSIASSLAASQPAAGVVKLALERVGPVICVSVPDELSMQAACRFADDHKLLVELACSTTLVAAYKRELFDHVLPPSESSRSSVFVVCGGFKVSLDDLMGYRAQVDAYAQEYFEVHCDGKSIKVKK